MAAAAEEDGSDEMTEFTSSGHGEGDIISLCGLFPSPTMHHGKWPQGSIFSLRRWHPSPSAIGGISIMVCFGFALGVGGFVVMDGGRYLQHYKTDRQYLLNLPKKLSVCLSSMPVIRDGQTNIYFTKCDGQTTR